MLPVYDYKCIEGHYQTISHGFDNEPKLFCGKCGGIMLKVYSVPATIFKGEGFYSTDKKNDR